MKQKTKIIIANIIFACIIIGINLFFGMRYPKPNERNNNWQECYSISFLNRDTTITYFTSSREDEYSNKSIKIKFDGGMCYVKILTWRNTEENFALMRETANIVVNYK